MRGDLQHNDFTILRFEPPELRLYRLLALKRDTYFYILGFFCETMNALSRMLINKIVVDMLFSLPGLMWLRYLIPFQRNTLIKHQQQLE